MSNQNHTINDPANELQDAYPYSLYVENVAHDVAHAAGIHNLRQRLQGLTALQKEAVLHMVRELIYRLTHDMDDLPIAEYLLDLVFSERPDLTFLVDYDYEDLNH